MRCALDGQGQIQVASRERKRTGLLERSDTLCDITDRSPKGDGATYGEHATWLLLPD